MRTTNDKSPLRRDIDSLDEIKERLRQLYRMKAALRDIRDMCDDQTNLISRIDIKAICDEVLDGNN